MAKATGNFRNTTVEYIFKAVQRQKGPDLSGMIIVDSTIFKAILKTVSEEELRQLMIDHPMGPASNDLSDVSSWCSLYFETLAHLDDKIKTQTDFGSAVGLSQGDVSSLMNARRGFYFGADRIEGLFDSIKNIISGLRKKAS